jgi:hypothetical protein
MNKILRDRLIEAVKLSLNECGDSSKEMIANNIVRFEQTGMANAANPGEFAPEEITDVKNLENTASMANDTDFNKDENCAPCDMINDLEKSMENLASDLIDISVRDEEKEEKPIMESSFRRNLTRTLTESDFGEEQYKVYFWPFSGYDLHPIEVEAYNEEEALEKAVAKLEEEGLVGFFADDVEDVENHPDLYLYVDATMEGASEPHYIDAQNLRIEKVGSLGESSFVKSIKKSLTESDYAAPLKYVPDTRINAADVLNALKAKIGDGSEALHITSELDEEGNKLFSVSQIDKDKLPKEIDVESVTLKLGDKGYSIEKTVSDFPVKKG